jgi:ABC-type sugar transport system substrate-binding protein
VSQNDAMAIGARKAFQEISDAAARERFAHLPYLGVDGVPGTGQLWLRRGLLNATVIVPPNTDAAIQMLAQALQTGTMPPEKTKTSPRSLPSIEELAGIVVKKRQAAGQAK